ncbi:unnamed protein product [Chironomus riparius]|uniref:Uncharacterized protein n=1 Tax=Chironomus riparius TaxID=315576 RepID=A0A9N9WYP1_9DIPT|nr:unnamed protein product [Chironomus riparius]
MSYFIGKLIFLSIFIILAKSDTTFDPILQSYRSNYLSLKGSAYSSLDKSFFDVYNLLKSKIAEIRDTYSQYSAVMNKSCSNFEYNNTKSGTGSRLMSFCGTTNSIMDYTSQELDDLITNFYYGTLGGDTEPLKVADYMWQSGDDNLNSLPFLYDKSSSCMSSNLVAYLQIFRKNINNIISKSTIVTRNITSTFLNTVSETKNIGDFIKNMAGELNSCNKLNDSTKCVRQFLVNFSNCEEQVSCSTEKLQQTIENCTNLVSEIKLLYHENMMDAKEQVFKIDDDLDEWTNTVNKCISTKMSTSKTTTTDRSVKNTRTTAKNTTATARRNTTTPTKSSSTTTTRKATTTTPNKTTTTPNKTTSPTTRRTTPTTTKSASTSTTSTKPRRRS